MSDFSLGDRMKRYEDAQSVYLTRRIPVIIRIDGKAFHTLTRRHFPRGYSEVFADIMWHVMVVVADDLQGCVFAYQQSDEISFCLTDYRSIATDFGYKIQKIVSLSAALASVVFSDYSEHAGMFDSRAFIVPHDEVCNYFVWRQQDATRNAIQMLGQQYFSPKKLHKKSCNDIQDMLMTEHSINFNDCPTIQKRGCCYNPAEDEIDTEPPIFSKEREYIERLVFCRED